MMYQHSTQNRKSWLISLIVFVLLSACEKEREATPLKQDVRSDKNQILALGFDTTGLKDQGEFYIVESDILLRKDQLYDYQPAILVSEVDSVKETNPVNGRKGQARGSALISLANQNNITVFVDNTIPTAGDDNWRTEVQQAIADINTIPSRIRMQYVTTGPADITIRSDAGFFGDQTVAGAEPPVNGNAGPQIRINLDFFSNRIVTTGQKRYNMVHELGHSVGFRHTNWAVADPQETPPLEYREHQILVLILIQILL